MNPQTSTLIQFQCGPHHLAFPMNQVVHIEGDEKVTLNQRTTRPYGWLELDGKKIPVIDLGCYLGETAHQPGLPAHCIMIYKGSRTIILLVDKVIRAHPPNSLMLKPFGDSLRQLTKKLFAAVAKEDPVIFLLDFDGLALLAGMPSLPPAPIIATKPKLANTVSSTQSLLLSFSIGDHRHPTRWGLSAAQVAEVLKADLCVPMVKVPNYILGFIWWREEPVPIVDLNLRQGWQTHGQIDRILIARLAGASAHLGFPCQGDIRVESDLDSYQSVHIIPEEHGCLALGVFQKDQQVLVVPDVEAILV